MATRQSLHSLHDDYVRHARSPIDPGLWMLATRHFGAWASELPGEPLRKVGSKIYGGMLLLVQMTTGNVVYQEVKMGRDVSLKGARNVLIHPGVEIGDRCVIGSGVTLGTNSRFKDGVPKVGNDVVIENGAKILGPVTIGDGAVIRANSFVITDVPAGAIAMGVPARSVMPKREAASGDVAKSSETRLAAATSSKVADRKSVV